MTTSTQAYIQPFIVSRMRLQGVDKNTTSVSLYSRAHHIEGGLRLPIENLWEIAERTTFDRMYMKTVFISSYRYDLVLIHSAVATEEHGRKLLTGKWCLRVYVCEPIL